MSLLTELGSRATSPL